MAVPESIQSIVGKTVIQQSLGTSDRRLAQHLAIERAASWKRQFDLHKGVLREAPSSRDIFLEAQQRVAWLKGHFKDRDELDLQLDLLWNEYADREAARLGVLDISDAEPADVVPEVAAALDGIKSAMSGKHEVPKEYGTPFSELAKAYLDDRQRDAGSKLTMQTVSQMEATYRLFRDHIADAPLATVDRKIVTSFLDKIKRLNPNWGRSSQTKSRTLDQLLAAYGKATGPKVTNKTLNRYVSALSGLWDWARNRGEATGENPFEGHWSKAKNRKDANSPWHVSPLKAVLALEKSPGAQGAPNPLYWLPRIALLSGMRLNEICSLERSDIKEVDGVFYFDIPEGKTESSVRVVPVHSALRGFIDMCPASGFLFPHLKPGGPDRKRSWYVSRDFGRRTSNIEGRSTFHGFRKNVSEQLERCRVPETETAQILGHAKTGMTYGVYSPNGLTIQQKQGLIELLRLPD